MAYKNILAAVGLIAVGVWYGVLTSGLPERALSNNTPGPSFFPWLVTAMMLVLSLGLLVQGILELRRAGQRPELGPVRWRLVALLFAFVLYLAALPYAGFIAASIPFFAALMAIYGGRNWLFIVGMAVSMPIVLYLLFRHVFQILLPTGVW